MLYIGQRQVCLVISVTDEMSKSGMLRWGIASCGLISHDFCNAINIVRSTGGAHKIVAVGARGDVSKAERFARTHNIDKCYGSYEQLAQDSDVDIVYVGSVNSTHYHITSLMLTHDKHVLCEKPMTLSYGDTLSLTALARQRKLFLMEGMWSRCTPVYQRLREELSAGSIGEVHSLVANFCVPIVGRERIVSKELGGSVLLDIGVYLLQLSSLVFGNQPSGTTFTGHKAHTGVDEYMSVVLQYNGDRQVAQLYCDGRFKGPDNSARIHGSKGSITVCPPFHTPLSLVTPSGQHDYPLPRAVTSDSGGSVELPPMNHENSENFMHEIEHVTQCLRDGKLESEWMPHADSLHIAKLMDDGLKAVGVDLQSS